MPVEGTNPFAILCPPHRWDVILRGSKKQVAVIVVLDGSDGPLVPFEENRPLRGEMGEGGIT